MRGGLAGGAIAFRQELSPGTHCLGWQQSHHRGSNDRPASRSVELGVVTLPQTLGQALDALAADTVLGSAVGDDFVAGFIETMRCEWIEY